MSNGQIRRWDGVSPKIENVENVARYFGVSVDYLLGRTDNPDVNNDSPRLLSAHISQELNDEDMEELNQFIEFLRSKKKNKK